MVLRASLVLNLGKFSSSSKAVLWIRIRDPVLFDPGIRDEEKIRIRDVSGHFSESVKTVFWVKT
jgi:hypothetical protein